MNGRLGLRGQLCWTKQEKSAGRPDRRSISARSGDPKGTRHRDSKSVRPAGKLSMPFTLSKETLFKEPFLPGMLKRRKLLLGKVCWKSAPFIRKRATDDFQRHQLFIARRLFNGACRPERHRKIDALIRPRPSDEAEKRKDSSI